MNDSATEKKTIEAAVLLHARLQTAIMLCILLLLIGAVLFLGGRFRALEEGILTLGLDVQALDMGEIGDTVRSLNEAADTLSSLDMGSFNGTVTALRDAAEQLGAVDISAMNGAVTSLKDAADKLNKVDVQQLNGAVSALKGAAETLKDVDVAALNSLVEALETVSTKLQNAVNGITGIFGGRA